MMIVIIVLMALLLFIQVFTAGAGVDGRSHGALLSSSVVGIINAVLGIIVAAIFAAN